MALQNSDNFLVNRSGQSYKVNFQEVNADATQALADAAAAQAAADAAQATADEALGLATPSEVPLSSGSFDMSLGFMFSAGAITIANPINTTVGKSGLIRITAGPVVWGSNFKFPGGTAPGISAFPTVIPYYVQNSTTILMGNPTQGIA